MQRSGRHPRLQVRDPRIESPRPHSFSLLICLAAEWGQLVRPARQWPTPCSFFSRSQQRVGSAQLRSLARGRSIEPTRAPFGPVGPKPAQSGSFSFSFFCLVFSPPNQVQTKSNLFEFGSNLFKPCAACNLCILAPIMTYHILFWVGKCEEGDGADHFVKWAYIFG